MMSYIDLNVFIIILNQLWALDHAGISSQYRNVTCEWGLFDLALLAVS